MVVSIIADLGIVKSESLKTARIFEELIGDHLRFWSSVHQREDHLAGAMQAGGPGSGRLEVW